MHQLNSLFLDGNKRLDRTRYKSGCMRRFFGASPHTVVGVVNYHEYRILDFIFEKKCDRLAFLGFSKLMLFVIQKSVMHESRIEGFDLWMDQKQL